MSVRRFRDRWLRATAGVLLPREKTPHIGHVLRRDDLVPSLPLPELGLIASEKQCDLPLRPTPILSPPSQSGSKFSLVRVRASNDVLKRMRERTPDASHEEVKGYRATAARKVEQRARREALNYTPGDLARSGSAETPQHPLTQVLVDRPRLCPTHPAEEGSKSADPELANHDLRNGEAESVEVLNVFDRACRQPRRLNSSGRSDAPQRTREGSAQKWQVIVN